MRIKFQTGQQREFLKRVIAKINCPSLRELISRGIEVNYSTLKNYYNEERCLPDSLFYEFIEISGLSKNEFNFDVVDDHWGQVKGGKKSRK
jgi:hypothetical protein